MILDDKIILVGKLTTVNEPNLYNEVLPEALLVKELNSADFKELLYWNAVVGTLCLDSQYIDVNSDNKAIRLIGYDENLIGKFEILDTPQGNIVKELYNQGKKFIFGYNGGGLYYTREDGFNEMIALSLDTFNIIKVVD